MNQPSTGVNRNVCLIFVRTYTNGPCSTSFSTVVDPPSWSDAANSFESMSHCEEDKDDLPSDKDPSRSGVDEGRDS